MSRQFTFFESLKGKTYRARKVARPISIRGYNHIVVKARYPVLRLNHLLIKRILMETQDRFGIKLHAFSIMEDHCHLVVKVESRRQFSDALRFFTGMVALKLAKGMKSINGKMLGNKLIGGKLWAERAWSRVVQYGRDYAGAVRYVWNNPWRARIGSLLVDCIYITNGVLFGELEAPPPVVSNPGGGQVSFAFAE